MKIKTAEVELNQPLTAIQLDGSYSECYCLMRHESVPIGWLRIKGLMNEKEITVARLSMETIKQLDNRIIENSFTGIFKKEKTDIKLTEGISIVVCTRNRTEFLAKCLEALMELDYPLFEIIIVDNAPNDERTLQLVSGYPVRYVREDRPGLDWARNRGIAEAQYSIIAFTDDDARVDKQWLKAIGKGFSNPDVKAVSGFVAAAELDTRARQDFEFIYGGMSHGLRSKSILKENTSNHRLLWAGSLGVGVNMAFRKSLFSEVGNFDVSLDAGTATRGGGDIDMLFRIVMKNHLLVYLPDAIVWHSHRANDEGLRKQIMDNGCSFACFLYTAIDKKYLPASEVRWFFLKEWLIGRLIKNLVKPEKAGLRKLIWYEFRGMLESRKAYRTAKNR